MSTIANLFNGLIEPLGQTTLSELARANKLKLALAGGMFGLAALITFETRPAPARTNAPIIRVVSNNDIDGVRDVLEKDPSQLGGLDLDGNTPLHIAARGGYADMVDLLIAAGADVNLPNRQGWTPLASALLSREKNQLGIVKALLAAGARSDSSISDGRTVQQLARTLPGVSPKVKSLIGGDPRGAAGAAYASTADARK